MEGSRKKGKILKRNYPLIMIIISIIMISSGLYLNYYTIPRIQLTNTFNKLIMMIENTKNYQNITGISEDFTLNSSIKLNVESQMVQKSVKPDDLKNKNLIKNLNNTLTNIKLVQDKTNKKMYVNINTFLPQEELML